MAVTGISRYLRLWKHIANPFDYLIYKNERHKRDCFFVTKPFPIRFRVPNSLYLVFKEIFMTDVYEIDRLASQLPSNPTIIDIGANAGFFDIQLLSKIGQATIYAYEPMPANVKSLQETIANNSRLQRCVHLFAMAVTGRAFAQLSLFAEPEENSQVVASVFAEFHQNNTCELTVPCITLAEIMLENSLQTVDLLKMDCEGGEYDIMYHTDPELIRRIRQMTIEVHDVDTDRNNVTAFDRYLQEMDYTTSCSRINSSCYALEAIR
jgi:FkbM family methyltransferase